ncbi:hypothetical protein K523DRAFT_343474 [Schizophyllum commune Tattone D]|nr:hypothetical protein K525DRAFT_242895 [Schizophyllum commune Loenen D]KAI5824207.1 hypothetical protein K523DRAFT_343474 [Schizophyllum commune Tattone D]
MVVPTTGTSNAGSEASRATSQDTGAEYPTNAQQDVDTSDDLGSRGELDPTQDTRPAQTFSPFSSGMSAELSTWDDPSVQGWGYWPPEPCLSTDAPRETNAGPTALENTSIPATLTITVFDDTLYCEPPQPPVHLGPPHVCPVCERHYMRPSCLSMHMNIHRQQTMRYSYGNQGCTSRARNEEVAGVHRYRYRYSFA